MNNEQIAHDLAVTFSGIALKEKNGDMFSELNLEYAAIANVLIKEYQNIYPELLNILNNKR